MTYQALMYNPVARTIKAMFCADKEAVSVAPGSSSQPDDTHRRNPAEILILLESTANSDHEQ
jgi:hypothetical protein